MTPAELLSLYSEPFKSIVNSDIRGEVDQETAESLRSPEVSRRWHTTLVATKRSIETQFATYKIEKAQKLAKAEKGFEEWLASKQAWQTGALRFQVSVEDKIAEAKTYLRRETTEVDLLKQAIADHKVRCISDPENAEDWDEELWQSIN